MNKTINITYSFELEISDEVLGEESIKQELVDVRDMIDRHIQELVGKESYDTKIIDIG